MLQIRFRAIFLLVGVLTCLVIWDKPLYAQIPSISITPSSTQRVGQEITLTVLVTATGGLEGVPSTSANTPVQLIISGANSSLNLSTVITTNLTGQAQFSYTGYYAGQDVITATVEPPIGQSISTTVTWRAVLLDLIPQSAIDYVGIPYSAIISATEALPTNLECVSCPKTKALPGINVNLTVTKTHSRSDTVVTDSAGKALFTYPGLRPGPDDITAWIDLDNDNVLDPFDPKDTASMFWEGITLQLEPRAATNDVGTLHQVTATLDTFATPEALPDREVRFEVTGANQATGRFISDATNQVSFSYTGTVVGTDIITAWVDLNNDANLNNFEPRDAVTQTWKPVYRVTVTPFQAEQVPGTEHTVTITVTDHLSRPVANVATTFTVEGVNPTKLSATTDETGQATLRYTGFYDGHDQITIWVDLNRNQVEEPAEQEIYNAYVEWNQVTIELTALLRERSVGTRQAMTATVLAEPANSDDEYIVMPNARVGFTVTGINSLTSSTVTTLDSLAYWGYRGSNNISGTDTITAWVDLDRDAQFDPSFEAQDVIRVTWRPITLTVTGTGVAAPGGATRFITATVRNDLGQSVDDVDAAFTLNERLLKIRTTDEAGQAYFSYFSQYPAQSATNRNEALIAAQTTATGCDTVLPAGSLDKINIWVELIADGQRRGNEPGIICEVPSAIELAYFSADIVADQVHLRWETRSETDNAGFNLYQATSRAGIYTKINVSLIPGQMTGYGATYHFIDRPLTPGPIYYKLEDVDYNGHSTFHGPITAQGGGVIEAGLNPVYLPLVVR